MGKNLAKNIPSLTGVRGAAAAVVVLYHYAEIPSLTAGNLHAPFSGYLGVDLFFVLSGFLMGLNYGTLFDRGTTLSGYMDFLCKRFARVYPLYAFITLLIFCLSYWGIFQSWVRIRLLIVDLALFQQLGASLVDPYLGNSIVDGSWSISTELGAYLLFPILYFAACRSNRGVHLVTWIATVLSIALLVFMPWSWKPQGLPAQGPLDIWNARPLWPLLRCLSEFTCGLLVFRVLRRKPDSAVGNDYVGIAILVVLTLSLIVPGADFVAVAAIASLVAHLATQNSWLSRAFGSGPMVWLGNVSYALYLLHLPVVELMIRHPVGVFRNPIWTQHQRITLVVAAVVALALARLAFIAIEDPARRLLRNAMSSPAKRPTELEPAAP